MPDLFDQMTPPDLMPEIPVAEEDPKLKEISELSKQGYAFLKENNITDIRLLSMQTLSTKISTKIFI